MIKSRMSRRDAILGGAAVAATSLAAVWRPGAAVGFEPLPAVGAWPWPARGLDAVQTARGSTEALSGCGGTSSGLLIAGLRKALPASAWTALPLQLASFANGGGPFGSDCGALQGPLMVMSLAGAPPALRQEFFGWYCGFAFPSPEWDDLYPLRATVRTVSHSPLCHESRAIWNTAYFGQAAKADGPDDTRCAKLTRDCVKKAVELLNAYKLTGYAGAWAPGETYKACYDCHTGLEAKREPGAIHTGREDCTRCHAGVAPHSQ